MKLRIGDVELASNVLFAPMAGYSDVGARYLARLYGAGLTCSEMISAKGLVYDNAQTKMLLTRAPNETPYAVQLFAASPADIAAAVKLLPDYVDIVDINMGCPAPKIVKNGEGSALMKNIDLAGEIIHAAAVSSKRPVTVKMRLGFENGDFVADALAAEAERAGAKAVCVHGRYREQMYSGTVDLDGIKKVKDKVHIPVIGNGDVKSRADFDKMLAVTGVDGVMIGRWAIGNFRIFAEISGSDICRSVPEDVDEHIRLLQGLYPERTVVNLMKSHVSAYASGVPGRAKQLREAAHAATTLAEMRQIAAEIGGAESV